MKRSKAIRNNEETPVLEDKHKIVRVSEEDEISVSWRFSPNVVLCPVRNERKRESLALEIMSDLWRDWLEK